MSSQEALPRAGSTLTPQPRAPRDAAVRPRAGHTRVREPTVARAEVHAQDPAPPPGAGEPGGRGRPRPGGRPPGRLVFVPAPRARGRGAPGFVRDPIPAARGRRT